jgi:hypothetical protein
MSKELRKAYVNQLQAVRDEVEELIPLLRNGPQGLEGRIEMLILGAAESRRLEKMVLSDLTVEAL